ncbi:MAG: oligosaccharide flippase family protein, partial [Melioribacteraceae bacterium]
ISDFNVQTKYLIIIFSFYASFTTLTNFLYALYKGNEKLQYEAKVSFIINFGALVIIMLLIFLKQNIIVLAITFSATRLLGMFIAIYYAYHLVPNLKFKVEFKETKNVFSQVMIFGMFLIFGNLFFQLDTILLAFLKGEESVGIYQAVFRLIVLPLLIPEVIINSLLPTLSRLNSENNLKWQKLSEIFNKFLLILSFPISISIYLFADVIIGIVYGTEEYNMAIPVLRIFAFIVFIRFCFEGNGLILTTSKRQKTRMQIVFVATILNLILNYFLIPKFGVFGAAYVSLFTNGFVAIAYFIVTKKSITFPIHSMVNLKFASIIIFLLLSSLLFEYLKIGYFGILSVIIYFYYIVIYVMTDQEKNYFKELSILKITRNSKLT